jgi:hypothetical protein
VPAAINNFTPSIDIVHPDGWHELSYISGVPVVTNPTNIQIPGTDYLGDIAVGDFVRAGEQTDWPCLPDDFHRCLADVAAIKILYELNLLDKAQALEATVGNDLQRFRSLLLPRVKADPKVIPIIRRSRGYGYPGWRLS